jgi:hypothetical protein
MSVCVIGSILWKACGSILSGFAQSDPRNRTAIASAVYFFYTDDITGADTYASIAFAGYERSEHLDHFPAQFQGNKSVSVDVEAGYSLAFPHNRRFEGLSRLRAELEERVEDWANHQQLEADSTEDCDGKGEERSDQALSDHTGRAEANEEIEQHAWGEPRPDVRLPAVGVDVRRVSVNPRVHIVVSGVNDVVRMTCRVPDAVQRRNGVTVPDIVSGVEGVAAGAVHVMASSVVTAVTPAMAAREAEEGHRGHTGGAEDEGEDVEIQLTTRWYAVDAQVAKQLLRKERGSKSRGDSVE